MLKNTYLLKVSWVVLKFLNERNLIENRVGKYFEDNDRLCGKHREIYGKFWRQPKQCFHPNHLKPSNGQKSCKVLTASFHQVMEQSKFHNVNIPIGDGLCIAHKKAITTTKTQLDEKNDNDTGMNPTNLSFQIVSLLAFHILVKVLYLLLWKP